jgi:hypothetical protein
VEEPGFLTALTDLANYYLCFLLRHLSLPPPYYSSLQVSSLWRKGVGQGFTGQNFSPRIQATLRFVANKRGLSLPRKVVKIASDAVAIAI